MSANRRGEDTFSSAVSTLVSCRRQVSELLHAAATNGNIQEAGQRLIISSQSVQVLCTEIDRTLSQHDNTQEKPRIAPPALDAACLQWQYYDRVTPTLPPQPKRPRTPACIKSSTPAALAAFATTCVPSWLCSRSHAPLYLCGRPSVWRANEIVELELRIDGVFTAIVAVQPEEELVETAMRTDAYSNVANSTAGAYDGASRTAWVPTRVTVGPSHTVMPAGASQPADHLVFRDLSARAGAILVGLEVLTPAYRLRPLLRWLSSLHDLFDSTCVACGRVFAPSAPEKAELIPPTARCQRLRPYHDECYLAAYGNPAEENFIEGALLDAPTVIHHQTTT